MKNKIKITAVLAATAMLVGTAIPVSAVTTDNTITFESNPTTGFTWSGFVVGGDAVELMSSTGEYISDENDSMLCGVGGETTFSILPIKEGRSIIRFDYAREWESEPIETRFILAEVDEELTLTTMDITESCMIEGRVTGIDADEFAVTLTAASGEEILAVFEETMALPVMSEEIRIYTDGTMTDSLPGMVGVIGWECVPSETARAF